MYMATHLKKFFLKLFLLVDSIKSQEYVNKIRKIYLYLMVHSQV